MSAKINELKLKKALLRFCSEGTTGNILAKLADRNIVHIETMERVFPRFIAHADKPDVPLVKCVAFIEGFIRADFFGDITVDIIHGKILDVRVKKIYKPRDIEKEICGAGSAR